MPVLYALSLSKYVNSAGTDIGFASLLAVALLAVLYFAGARESRTLRDQLEEAQERIAGLEARVTQMLRQSGARAGAAAPATPAAAPAARAPAPSRPGVVPAPTVSGVGPMGSAVARVQRQAGAVTTAGALGLAGAPAGAGAPALGSATTLIPAPGPVPVRAPAAVPVGAGATVAAVSSIGYAQLEDEEDDYDEVSPEDTMFVPASTSAGNGGGPGSVPRFARSEDRFDPDEDQDAPPPRRTIPTVDAVTSRPLAGRLLGALAAVVVLVVIVVALLAITSSGGSSPSQTVAQTPSRPKPTRTAVRFNPASVTVSVLNGTAVGGLAADVGKDLSGAGFTVPATAVTNAATQTETTTTVGYRSGARAAAERVAAAITKATGVAVSTVTPVDPTAVTSCATPTGSGQAGTCPASVIVTVGSDLSGAANSSAAG